MKSVPLTQFGFLAVTGKDAVSFMQGYSTCDLESLTDKQAMMGAICNIKGRMIASFLATKIENGLLLRMNKNLVPITSAFLSKYIVFSKASLSDMSESFACYGVFGERPESSALTFKISDNDSRFEIWSDQPLATADSDDQDSLSQWRLADIEDGIAWVDEVSTEQYIPQMFNYQNLQAIDFDKGCYLGQEIIARLQFRGELKKKLHRGTSPIALEIGSSLDGIEGKVLGEVVSIAATGNEYRLLAVLRNDGTDTVDIALANGSTLKMKPV